MKAHQYQVNVEWTGNKGSGTFDYRSYGREHTVTVADKEAPIHCSSDPSFRGDSKRYNPEELFVASLSSCHMLWYLHLCAVNDVIVLEYTDNASGKMIENVNGSGQFESVTLYPEVVVSKTEMIEKAKELHEKAHEMCFIANSCAFPVTCEAQCIVK